MSKSSWDDSRSPLDRRPANNTLSPSPATGSSTSYKANVNRQKTRRWEAKPVSYDGDDWGGGDDYDEYDQESHEPPTVAQPTGLRQPGQSFDSTPRDKSVGNLGSVPSGVDQGRRQYGSLPSLGPVKQQPGRSVTSPVPPAINTDVGRPRANSFDEGDEGRAFPQNQVPPMVTQSGERPYAPPTRFSQMGFGGPGAVGASPGVISPLDQRRPPSGVVQQGPPRPSSRTSSISVGSARGREYPSQPASSAGPPRGDYSSRDFSPPAMPNPVHSRGVSTSPVNQVATPDTSHGGRFPPRKSSLSQLGPYSPTARASSAPPPGDGPPVGSQSRSSSVSVGSGVRQANQERPGSATDKPRPFIRPADIYKRMEEEREKERKSLDSARPSLDISTNHRAADHEATTASAPTAGLRERLSSESLGRGVRARQSLESIDGTESGKRLRPSLDPVRERKSEYGFEALPANAPKYSSDPEAPRVAGEPPSEALLSGCGPPMSTSNPTATSAGELGSSQRASIGPLLPDLSRFSGFGDAWLSGPSDSGYTPASSDINPAPSQPETVPRKQGVDSEVPLSHQPSVGFRSIVHQAFDRVDDKSAPPTPALSATGSQRSNGGDGVRRTDSASTSGISPIMSRVPSSTVTTGKARGSEGRESGTPAIAEEESLDSRRNSKTSISLGNQSQAVIRKPPPSPSPTPHNTSTDSLPLSFKMGHRRDLSTPSTSNSPKRSPVLEYNNQLPAGEKVELATQPMGLGLGQRIPPTPERALDSEGTNANCTTGGVDIATAVDPSPGGEAAITRGVPESPASPKRDSLSTLPSILPEGSDPRSGSRSPTKGVVGGLADKFEISNQRLGVDDRTRPVSGSKWSGEKHEVSRSVLPRSTVSSVVSTGVTDPDDGQREAGHTIDNSDQPSSSSGQYSIGERDTLEAGMVKHKDVDLVPTIEKRTLVQPPQGQLFKGPLNGALSDARGAPVAATGFRGYGLPDPANQTVATISAFDGSQRTPASIPPAPEGTITDRLSNHPASSSANPRSQLVNTGSLSSRSSIPPPPPPKDTQPIDGSSEAGLSYVAPIAPPKRGSIDQMSARDAASTSEFFSQPSVPPIQATRNYQEGDRTSKEVAGESSGSRSPRPILGAPTAPPMNAEGLRADRRISVGSGAPEPRPESSYLPSVYDDYFTGGDDDNENDNPHVPTSQPEVLIGTSDKRIEVGGIPPPADIGQNEKAGVLAPASIQRDEQATGLDTVPVRPLLLRNRFSWEAYGDEVEPTAATSSTTYHGADASTAHNGQTLQRDQSFSSVTTPDPELRQLIGTRSAYLDRTGSLPDSQLQKYTTHSPTGSPVDRPQGLSHGTSIQPSSVTGTGSIPKNVSRQTGALTPVERIAASSDKITEKSDDRPTTSDLEVADINAGGERGALHVLEGTAVAGPAVAELPAQHQPGDHETATPEPAPGQTSRPSTTQSSAEKGHAVAPEPTLNIEDRPSYSSATGTPSTAEAPDFVSRQPSQETAAPMPPQSASAQAKFPSFREILALKSPAERIKTYNENREQFATMNSGLAHWIAVTSSQNPELAGPIPRGSLPQISTGGRGSPSRSAFHKHSPSGPTPPLQEPYYKQYMQFSSTTPSPTAYSGSAPRPPASVIPSALGFSPSESGGAKQSSQSTQHKRMELFHTIGGRAGGAAKGLFAKGRNKFKGDKASNTPSSLQASPASSRSVQLPPESQRQQQRQRPVSLQFPQPSSPSNRGPSSAAPPAHDVMGGSASSQGYWLRQRTPPQPAANQPQERHLQLKNPDQPGQSPQQPQKSGFRLFGGAKKQDSPKQPVEYLTRGEVAPQPPPPLQPQPHAQGGGVGLDIRRSQQHIGDRAEPLPSRDASYLLDRSSSDVSTPAPPVHDYLAPRALPPHLTAYPASVDGNRSAATESPVLGSDPIYHGKRPTHPEGTLAMSTEKRSGSPADDGDSKTQSRIDHPEALALPGAPATSRGVSPVPSYVHEAKQNEAISQRSVSIVSRDVSPVRSVVGDMEDDYAPESPRPQQKLKISESLEKAEEDSGFVGLPPARRSSTFDVDVGSFKGGKEIEADVGTSGNLGEGSGERVAEPVPFAITGVGAGLTKTDRQVRGAHDDDDVSSVQLESEPEPELDHPKLVTTSQQSASSGSDSTPKGEGFSFPDHEVQRPPDTEAVLPQVPHRVPHDSSHQATFSVPASQRSRTSDTLPLQPPLVPPLEQQQTPAGNSRGSPEPFTPAIPHHLVNERLSQRPPGETLPPLQTAPVLPPEGQQEPPGDRRPHRTFTLPAPQSPIDQRLSLTTTPTQHVSPTRYGREQGYRSPDLGPRGDPRAGYLPQFVAPGQHLPNAPLRGLSMPSSQVLRGPPGQDQRPNQPLGFSGPPLTQQQPGVPRYLVGGSGLPSDVSTQFYTRQLPPSESLYAPQQGADYQPRAVGPPGTHSVQQPPPPKAKRGSGFFKSLSMSSKPDKPPQTSAGPLQPAPSLPTLAERNSRVSTSTMGSGSEQQEKKQKRSSFFGALTIGLSSEDQRQQQQQQQEQQLRQQQRQQQYQQPQQQQQYQEPPQSQPQQQLPPPRERASWYNHGPGHRASQQNAVDFPPPIVPESTRSGLAVVPPAHGPPRLVHAESGPPRVGRGPVTAGPVPAPFPLRESSRSGHPDSDSPRIAGPGGPPVLSAAPVPPQAHGSPYLTRSASDVPRTYGFPAPPPGLGASAPPPTGGPLRPIHQSSEPPRSGRAPALGPGVARFMASPPPSGSSPGPGYPGPTPLDPRSSHMQGPPRSFTDITEAKLRNKLTRSGTAGGALETPGGKKRGFSGLSSLFSRSGTTGHKHSASTPTVSQPLLGSGQPTLARSSPHSLHPVAETRDGSPPLEGYYAPRSAQGPLLSRQAQSTQPPPSGLRSPEESNFIGGRRLSEQQIATAKHTFESEQGFRGPHRPPGSPPSSQSAALHAPEPPTAKRGSTPTAQPPAQPTGMEPSPPQPLHCVEPQYETQPIPAPYSPSVPAATVPAPAFIPVLFPPGFDPARLPQGMPGHYVYIPHPIGHGGGSPPPQSQVAVSQPPAGSRSPHRVPFTIAAPTPISPTAIQQQTGPNTGSPVLALPPAVAQQQSTSSPPPANSPVLTQQQAIPTNPTNPTPRVTQKQSHLPALNTNTSHTTSATAEARSSPKEHPDQQTPWTLSIPGESVAEPPSRTLTPIRPPTPPHIEPSNPPAAQQDEDTVHSGKPAHSPSSTPLPDSRLASPLSQTPTPSAPITRTSSTVTPPFPPLPPKIPQSTPPSPAPQTPTADPPPPPPRTTLRRAPSSAAELEDTEPDAHIARRRAQEEKLLGFDSGGPRVGRESSIEEEGGAATATADGDDEEVVMMSTAYPGQEWAPEGYGRWEFD